METTRDGLLDEAAVCDMVHDLRISLSVVMGLSTSLLEDLSGELSEDHFTRLRMIVDSGSQMCELVDAAVGGRQGDVAQDIDVVALCESVAAWMRPRAEAKGLFLRMDDVGCEPSAHRVAHVDPHALSRILMNLLDNAVKFTHEGGVTIFLRCRQDALALAVTDTGCGILAAHIASVFDEGYRVASDGVPGTGHGLAACRRLAHEMGATISVGSSVPGQGTTFVLWLPWGLG